MGEEAIQYARSYASRAERKMGEMLAATERAKGTRVAGGNTGGPVVLPPVEDAPTLAELGITKRESSDAQFLAKLPEEEFEEVATGKKTIAEARRESAKPHVSNNSGDNEWYTPAEFIEAARAVMGSIDLDPASSEEANAVVKATRFYTAEEDGLTREWSGAVWMNPPYAGDLIGKFIEKLCDAHGIGAMSQACVLVNNATETRWFQTAASAASAIAFPCGRVKFWHPRKTAMPLQGQAVLYLGDNVDGFHQEFSRFGMVCRVIR